MAMPQPMFAAGEKFVCVDPMYPMTPYLSEIVCVTEVNSIPHYRIRFNGYEDPRYDLSVAVGEEEGIMFKTTNLAEIQEYCIERQRREGPSPPPVQARGGKRKSTAATAATGNARVGTSGSSKAARTPKANAIPKTKTVDKSPKAKAKTVGKTTQKTVTPKSKTSSAKDTPKTKIVAKSPKAKVKTVRKTTRKPVTPKSKTPTAKATQSKVASARRSTAAAAVATPALTTTRRASTATSRGRAAPK